MLCPDDHGNVGNEADLLEQVRSGRIAGLLLVLVLSTAVLFTSTDNTATASPTQQAGLMWNRSGLPAVFPLQVKTPPGQDYFLTLIDNDTGKAALAAYIKGGVFFKVLVPPGGFTLRFATGDVWQGEDALFGPGANTHLFELRKPLIFETRGFGIKAGHIVSLLEHQPGQIAQVAVKDQLVCQSIMFEFPSSSYSTSEMQPARGFQYQGRIGASSRSAADLERGISDRSRFRTDHRGYFAMPRYRYDVWSRYCG